jgi:hypothetical protein
MGASILVFMSNRLKIKFCAFVQVDDDIDVYPSFRNDSGTGFGNFLSIATQ